MSRTTSNCYHFRRFLDTGPFTNVDGVVLEIEGIERALLTALSISNDYGMSVTVCKDSGTVDMPAFTEVASVRACK